ncbi:MAG TPA: hypothetical protein VH063_11565 [Gaiellaceae bacterium]|nr:hypothetical protein [Gaiellaceae bacterium]
MSSTAMPRLSDQEFVEMAGLIKDADSVELKLTVPDSSHRSTIATLGIDPLEAQIRQVFFFDTPDLALNGAGVVVRARRIQGKGADSVVKLRPVVPAELAPEVRVSDNFNIEVDAMPGGFVCSGSMKWALGTVDARSVVAGSHPIRKLFSKEQRRFYRQHAPEGLELDSLSLLGPIFVLKGRIYPEDLGRRLVVEMWLYPDGSRILELSTKCAPSEAFQVAAEARAYFAGVGIGLDGDQQTKTKKALEFFAAELANGDSEAKLPEEKPPVEAAVADGDGDGDE